MKKIYALLIVLFVVASCNKEKIYKDNLQGVWEVYKYILNNTDKTTQFKAQHPDYNITFTNDGKFTERVVNPDTAFVNGTYTFADNDQKIVLTNPYFTYSQHQDSIIDSLFNVTYFTVYDSAQHTLTRKYTIFNLTKDHVQLRNDTSQLYMDKPEVQ